MKTGFRFTLTILCLVAFTQGCCVVRKSAVNLDGTNVRSSWASGDVRAGYKATTCASLFNSCCDDLDRRVGLLANKQLTPAEFADLYRSEQSIKRIEGGR